MITVLENLFQIKSLSTDIPSEKNTQINVNAVRDFQSRFYENLHEGWMVAKIIDTLKAMQSIFFKYVPAERSNGFFNLYVAFLYPNATWGGIESALVDMSDSKRNFGLKM